MKADNKRQLIDTPFGPFEIGSMQISDTYRERLMILLQEEFDLHSKDRTNPFSFEEIAQIVVRVWDRMRK